MSVKDIDTQEVSKAEGVLGLILGPVAEATGTGPERGSIRFGMEIPWP